MDEWNRHCRSGRQCGSAIQGLDRIWVRYLTDWVYSAITVAVAVAKWEGYGMLSAGQYEFLPCFLHVLEDAQIGLQIISGGGLDVGVSELSCDHADVGSGLDRQRAERVA